MLRNNQISNLLKLNFKIGHAYKQAATFFHQNASRLKTQVLFETKSEKENKKLPIETHFLHDAETKTIQLLETQTKKELGALRYSVADINFYIDFMENSITSEYRQTNYFNIGSALHEAAFRISCDLNKPHIKLCSYGSAIYFHYKNGFRPVYNQIIYPKFEPAVNKELSIKNLKHFTVTSHWENQFRKQIASHEDKKVVTKMWPTVWMELPQHTINVKRIALGLYKPVKNDQPTPLLDLNTALRLS